MILYHATSKDKWTKIQEEGLLPGTYLGEKNIAEYYAETVEDDGDEPIILAVDITDIPDAEVSPDLAGLEEPLTFTLGISEEEIEELWDETDKSWGACLELIGSVRVHCAIPAHSISESLEEDLSLS